MWSNYQKAVFDFASNGSGNAMVDAVAGSGKSTTGMETIMRFPTNRMGLFTTFTKIIIEDLGSKITASGAKHVKAQNYNSYGAAHIFKYMRPAPTLLTKNGEKTERILRKNVLGDGPEQLKTFYIVRSSVVRLVALFKALAVMSVEEADKRYDEIVDYYDVEIPKSKDFDFKQIVLDCWAANLGRNEIIDFQDQVFLPVYNQWPTKQYDFLIIDEYQDTCPIEAELMLSACMQGRIIVFGDPYQAIYAFKGTRPNSMKDFGERYGATRLPLSICYRCSKAVVNEAKKIVGHIEASPNAVEGSVNTINKQEMKGRITENDLVICRTTDHLVKSVTAFLQERRAAYVVGREYGTELKYFVNKIMDRNDDFLDIGRFIELLDRNFSEQHPVLVQTGKDHQAMMLETKTETIKILCVGCSNVGGLLRKIDSIFTDKGNGIRHMTIHKSKGLEANNVFLLRPDLLPHPRVKKPHLIEEEERLRYVAITRAKINLSYVLKDRDEK